MTEAAANPRTGTRKRVLTIMAGVFVVAAVIWGVYWLVFLRNWESTDDAYVGGYSVAVTPQVAGTVIAVGADDTNAVKAGETVVRLDPADAKLGLEQAENELAKTVRQVRNTLATVAHLQAMVNARRVDLGRAHDDLERRRKLVESGAISREELTHAAGALQGAEAGLESAQRQAAAVVALVEGTDVPHHPDVQSAAAKVRDAYLALARTDIPAPVSGTVARRTVQVGMRVSPGTTLMTVVQLDRLWVDANFKEGQLAGMRVGQPAKVVADVYGGKMTYHGKVLGFGAGTGSAFALLPAQNATGNWVKVVQRVPVRIGLDPQEIAAHPLAIGLSMNVDVDISDGNGSRTASPPGAVTETKVFDNFEDKANTRIAAIIAANMGARIPGQ